MFDQELQNSIFKSLLNVNNNIMCEWLKQYRNSHYNLSFNIICVEIFSLELCVHEFWERHENRIKIWDLECYDLKHVNTKFRFFLFLQLNISKQNYIFPDTPGHLDCVYLSETQENELPQNTHLEPGQQLSLTAAPTRPPLHKIFVKM